jgi:hypothetical protein
MGIIFLFMLIIVMGVISIYYIRVLASDTVRLTKDNQQSIDYVEHMNRDIEHIEFSTVAGLIPNMPGKGISMNDKENDFMFSDFNKNLDSEANNITETGEESAVKNLKSDFQNYKTAFYKAAGGNADGILSQYRILRSDLNTIYELNKKAIIEKNNLESKTASKGVFYVTLVGSIFILVAFVFLLTFPANIVP